MDHRERAPRSGRSHRLLPAIRAHVGAVAGMSVNVLDLINDAQLLGPYFEGSSWDRWRAVLRAAFALPMSVRDRKLFNEVAERAPPRRPVRELVCVVGRSGGKDAIASAVATYLAVTGDFSRLRPGERGDVLLIATDRDQAGICFDYLITRLMDKYATAVIEAADRWLAAVDEVMDAGEAARPNSEAVVAFAAAVKEWRQNRATSPFSALTTKAFMRCISPPRVSKRSNC
jgi:hypothetical protein